LDRGAPRKGVDSKGKWTKKKPFGQRGNGLKKEIQSLVNAGKERENLNKKIERAGGGGASNLKIESETVQSKRGTRGTL